MENSINISFLFETVPKWDFGSELLFVPQSELTRWVGVKDIVKDIYYQGGAPLFFCGRIFLGVVFFWEGIWIFRGIFDLGVVFKF